MTYSWLSWLCSLPSVVVGIIQGVLPAVLLAVLMMLLPIILRCVILHPYVHASCPYSSPCTQVTCTFRGHPYENWAGTELDVSILYLPSCGEYLCLRYSAFLWPDILKLQHSFLIVTVSSGIIAALPGIVKTPGSAVTLLAQNLPQASIFFLTCVLVFIHSVRYIRLNRRICYFTGILFCKAFLELPLDFCRS